MLKPYMIFSQRASAHECAGLAFANSHKEARKVGGVRRGARHDLSDGQELGGLFCEWGGGAGEMGGGQPKCHVSFFCLFLN